jgi:hypothetical protein
MGFYVADVVTGRNLRSGQPVVGFVVQHQNNQYPLSDNPNACVAVPSAYFALESLPIFGTAEEFGKIEVDDENQLAVRLVLKMTGLTSWEEFNDKMFGSRDGVQFLGLPEPEEGSSRKSNNRRYGICLMHRDTYDHFVLQGRSVLGDYCANDGFEGLHRQPEDKTHDVETVKRLITECLQSPFNIWGKIDKDNPPSTEVFVKASNLSRVCSFAADWPELEDVFPEQTVPLLLKAMSFSDGKLFGQDFATLLRTTEIIGHRILEKGYESAEAIPDFDELLNAFWDCLHLKNRMYDVHALFKPSMYAGQDYNFPSVLELSRSTIGNVWSELVEQHVEHDIDVRHPERLNDELVRMEGLVASMRMCLSDARAAFERDSEERAIEAEQVEGDNGTAPVTYHLLGRGDVIQRGDEVLADDTVTWLPLVGWEVGKEWGSNFMPMRRRATL